MKKIFKAYFKLRKGWIITLYALLLLAGLASMVNDSVQWHKWESAITKNTNETEYQKFRAHYQEHAEMDVYSTITPEAYVKYLNLVQIKPEFYQVDRVIGKMVYQSAPADYQTFKDNLLDYYPHQDNRFLGGTDYRYGSGGQGNVQLNLVALMRDSILLTFVGIFALAIVLDQSKHITVFIGARTGGITKLHLVQFIYWVSIPMLTASVFSFITHLTRQFFIPAQYVRVPWEKVLEVSSDALSIALIAAISVSLVDALVGKPVYKIVTGVLAVPALGIGVANLRQLITYRPISDFLIKVPLLVYLLIFALIAIPIILILQKRQSLEQNSFYIKLKVLRLPFYIGIVILTILDFVLPFFMRERMVDAPLDVVINLVLTVGVLAVFAKLILDKDVRHLVKS